jgi:DNA mismatch repair ATPase MutS
MIFNRKKKVKDLFNQSFGKLKGETYNFDLIERYFRKKDNSRELQTLSDKTCNDLDFDELFMFLDRTNSKVGQQYLYNRLRTIPQASHEFSQQERIIKHFEETPGLRLDVQTLLARLNEQDTYYINSLFQHEHIMHPKWFFIIKFLSFANLLSIILLAVNLKMIFVIFAITIINTGIHYWNKKNLYQYLGSVPQLLRLNSIARKLFENDLFSSLDPSLNKSFAEIDKVRNRMHFFNLESKLQSDTEIFFTTILEIFKTLFLLEPLFLFSILKALNSKRVEIENVFTFVGQIDSFISIASLRVGLSLYCQPTFTKQSALVAKNVYHPLIPDCVENSICIDQKSILLTGSNMSGKTSFIRTIGINAITAQTINTCFAAQFSTPKLNIYSAIRISDDLMNDKSYYFEEVSTIKDMIDNSNNGKANLFLLDEIFKGTNTVERISAGKAVLSSLAKGDNIVFVSTHDIELTDLLVNEYELYHFSEKVDHKSVDFDYKLKEGKLKNRNAIRILQINGYPEEVINEAMEISRELDEVSLTKKVTAKI